MNEKPLITVIGLSGHSIFMDLVRFPEKGETVQGRKLFTEPGGKGYNQAVGCARMGAQTFFISSVGDDQYGKECINFLNKEGIDTSYIKTIKGQSTAVGIILTDINGDNRISVYHGASRLLTSEDIGASEDIIARSSILLLQLESDFETVSNAIDLALRHNVKVILNPAPAVELGQDILEKVYLLTPNEHEAKVIAGVDPEVEMDPGKLAAIIKDKGLKRLVITLGENGALLSTEDEEIMVAPARVPAVVDTTGAGDTFNAALAVCIAKGMKLEAAVKYAVIASALSVTRRGVMGSIPYGEEVDNFQEEKGKIYHLINDI